jgi:cell division protein FtsL
MKREKSHLNQDKNKMSFLLKLDFWVKNKTSLVILIKILVSLNNAIMFKMTYGVLSYEFSGLQKERKGQ